MIRRSGVANYFFILMYIEKHTSATAAGHAHREERGVTIALSCCKYSLMIGEYGEPSMAAG